MKALSPGSSKRLAHRQIFGETYVEANEAGTVARVTVPTAGNPDGQDAIEAVRELRSEVVPRAFAGVDAEVYVGGDTAEELDYHDTVNFLHSCSCSCSRSFLLLTLAFRSIVVPATAIGMNLLSVGAAYGLLVLVFQEESGTAPPDSVRPGRSTPGFRCSCSPSSSGSRWTTRCSCSVASASAARRPATRTPPSRATASDRCARLITGAALIIIAVFWGFAMGDTIAFQQMGFGVAVALLIDATIVRSVLVPATMKLLGERNWYLLWTRLAPGRTRRGRRAAVEHRAAPGDGRRELVILAPLSVLETAATTFGAPGSAGRPGGGRRPGWIPVEHQKKLVRS